MNDQQSAQPAWSPAGMSGKRASRRSVLHALGLGAVAVVGHAPTPAGAARLRSRPAANSARSAPSTLQTRRLPGGPTVAEKATELQYDVKRIFRFVADDVAYEAYPGALRGPTGTLWGLAGNAVDQAQLLAALLDQALVPTRFVVGELADADATNLLDSMRLDAATARAQSERTLRLPPELVDGTAWSPRLTADQQSQIAAQPRPDELIAAASGQLEDGLRLVADVLRDEQIVLPDTEFALPERERQQHVWLQYADGPAWIDLDPSFAGVAPGTVIAQPVETWDRLPDDLFHRVNFRVVAEAVSAGQPVTQDILRYEARSQDLVGETISFGHIEANALEAAGVAVSGLIQGTVQYIPHLLIGDGGEEGSPLSFVTGEGVLDAFGEASNEGDTLGEWLEIEVITPDAPVRRISREIFDRIGVDRRAGGPIDVTTIPLADLTDIPTLGRVYLPLETIWVIAVVGQQVNGRYYEQDYATEDLAADLAFAAHAYHTDRDVWQLAIAAGYGYRWYPDQPNLTAVSLTHMRNTDGEDRLATAVDLLHQGFGIVPIAGERPTVHPRVLAGVLSHVAERLAIEPPTDPSDPGPAEPIRSVGLVFEEAARRGVAIRALPPGSALPADIDVSAAARARIGQALAAGYLVIVPERAVPIAGADTVGWWQVDVTTGQTFDLMENGRGAAGPMSDEATIIIPRVRAARLAYRRELAIRIVYFIMGAIIGLSATAAVMKHP